MRIVRLALFGIAGLGIVLVGLAFAIGWRPFSSATAPAQPAAEIVPTNAPEPTLSADERAVVETMNTRAGAMAQAARDLRQLGQEIRATVAWKGKVKAAASIVTGGQKVIQQAALPFRYGPLKDRAKTVTDACGAAVTGLPAADVLTIASVAHISPQLETCERDLKRLQLSLSGLE
jgi:hypothetical protein